MIPSDAILNNLNTGIIILNKNLKIKYANNFCKIIFEKENLQNLPLSQLFMECKNIERILTAIKKNENLLNFEVECNLSTKKIFKISINYYKSEIILVIDDITEKKEAELRLMHTDKLAALGELAASIIHEIKNPLTSLKGFAELLPSRLNDKQFLNKFASIILEEINRLNNFIENLLKFARPSVGELKLLNVNKVVEDVVNLLKYELKNKDISLELNLKNTPQIKGDYNQLKQVFLNLLINAINAIESNGRIEIRNSIKLIKEEDGKYREYIIYEIKDNGRGIPDNIKEKIFQPFFTTGEKGTGLGLSIAQRIINQHNGFIGFDSRKGEGTTFYIYLPSERN